MKQKKMVNKKKISCILLLLLIQVLFIFGCQNDSKNIKIDDIRFSEVYWVNEQNIYHSDYEDNTGDLCFCVYDVNNKRNKEIGRIENPFDFSADIAVVKDKFYVYCNELPPDFQMGSDMYNHLIEIDTKSEKMRIIATDKTYQTLIYVDSIGDNIYSYKGKYQDEIGITYIDVINVNEDNDFETIIEKEFDYNRYIGEAILNISAYDEKLYLLVLRESEEKIGYYIEIYNSEGIKESEIELHGKVRNVVSNVHVSKFEVQNNICFIRNFNSNGILFELDNQDNILLQNEDLDISKNYTDNQNYLLLLSRHSGKYWLYNLETNVFTEYKDDAEYLISVLADYSNSHVLIINSAETRYLNIE